MHLSAQWLISALLNEVIMPSIPLVVINDYKISISYQQLTHLSSYSIRLLSLGCIERHNGNPFLTFNAFSVFFEGNHIFYICYYVASILSLYQSSPPLLQIPFFPSFRKELQRTLAGLK